MRFAVPLATLAALAAAHGEGQPNARRHHAAAARRVVEVS